MQVPATVVVVIVADDGLDGVGLGVATAPGALPGLALALGARFAAASGAGIDVGAGAQVLTRVVAGTGFGVGATLPIGAAVPPVDTAGAAPGAAGAAETGAALGFVIGAWLGFTGVERPGGVMLFSLGVSGAGVGVPVGVGVGVTVWAERMPLAIKSTASVHVLLI